MSGLKNVNSRGGSGPLGGATSGLRWAYGKECLLGDLRLFPVNDSVRCISPEKEAEEIAAQIDDGRLIPQINEKLRSFRGDGRDFREARRLQKYRAPIGHHIPECIGAPEKQSQHGAMQRATTENSLASRMPLMLQMKIYGQRGTLGISIAGGRGSLPYKEHDEGVFISRVAKGGPAEKSGLHIGDRVLEVNGLNMQEMTHHEAVCTLRNAGNCVKMKVLRERSVCPAPPIPAEVPETGSPVDTKLANPANPGNPAPKQDNSEPECMLSGPTETVLLCNGNGTFSDMEQSRTGLMSSTEPGKPMGWTARNAEDSFKANAFQTVKNTMAIPRIILTHPSTSDEDIEPLTQDPEDEDLDDFGDVESHAHSDCLNNAFYPP